MYLVIEDVLASSIEQWNEILICVKWTERPGYRTSCEPQPREPIRIRTYGVDWKMKLPEWVKKLLEQSKEDQLSAEQYGEIDRYVYDKIGAGDDPDDDESDFKAVEFSDPEDALLFEPDPEEKYACWDVKYIRRLFGFETIQHAPAWQELGKVRMPPGRLISFPNAFQYRMGPLELQDKTKPGHCRFLTLSLVDPMYRICSTRNVPPQQPDWIDGSEPHMDLKEALKLKEELMNVHVRKDEATFELAGNIVFTGFQ
ncbi:hypothetical protein CNMCM8812_005730 [Aspergillus fumigatus]|nr:hypothetical protein CNMCM8812_005730 [Aspergillus fumigatus]KAH3460133.1 hypothetical protein KXV78_003392 [Aspergillus fumigatus]